MSLYSNPKQYAREMRITERLAVLWCNHQLELQKIIQDARICPECGQSTLEYEGGSYEEQIPHYIYCENNEVVTYIGGVQAYTDCGFHTDVVGKHAFLETGMDFDPLLATRHGFEWNLQSWFLFAKKAILDIIKEDTENKVSV